PRSPPDRSATGRRFPRSCRSSRPPRLIRYRVATIPVGPRRRQRREIFDRAGEKPEKCELLHTLLPRFGAPYEAARPVLNNRGANSRGQAMNDVGAEMIELLERAGARYLEPDAYQTLLLNVGATQALRRYDGTEAYWDRVQAVLDAF